MITASSRTSQLLLLLAVHTFTHNNAAVIAQQPVYVYVSDYPSMVPSDAPSDVPSDAPSDAPSDVPSSLTGQVFDGFLDATEDEPMIGMEEDPIDGTKATIIDTIDWTTEDINVDPLEGEPAETGDKTDEVSEIINVDPVDDFEEATAGDTEWSDVVSIGSGVTPVRVNPIDFAGGNRRNRKLRG